jgi:glycosyltransferase involved in cell wall biosynthesis
VNLTARSGDNPALYYPWVYLKGGAERMLLELMTRSRHRWTLYTNHFEPDATFPEFAGLDVVPLTGVSVRRTARDVALAGLRLLTQRIDLSSHSSLFVVSEGVGNLVAWRSTIPTYCICLTPLKIAYDKVTRERFFRSRPRRNLYRLPVWLYSRIERKAWGRYQCVYPVSAEVRRRLLEARLVDADRIRVVHHGVDTDHFTPTGEREPYFLLPGRIMWTKNIELALEAWFRFKPDSTINPFRLVIAGMLDLKSRPYLAFLRRLSGGRDDVAFFPSPSDSELLRLYQACHGVLFSAPNEDWGLVPLEAMASGKPVIATDRGGPRESVIDGQTGLLRADHPDAFADAIRTLAAMPEHRLDQMSQAARTRALQFRWETFVEAMDTQVDEAAQQSMVSLNTALGRRPAPW